MQLWEAAAKPAFLTEEDLYLFNEGTHRRLYRTFGAHLTARDGLEGTEFTVWAPHADKVFVTGDFNGWDRTANPLSSRNGSGVWSGFITGVEKSARYKYYIVAEQGNFQTEKADPFGFWHETAPSTASVVCDLEYAWQDASWMERRAATFGLSSPVAIYEVHLGSWMRGTSQAGRWPSYREIGPKLAEHTRKLGFTHVELLPIMEHPFYGSWGYQTTGYFAPTSRYGTPQDLMFLIDCLHQNGLGVILDWVPSHFPMDAHGLAYFDGTHLFEYGDPRKGRQPDWKSLIFNYGRPEVRSFLLSSAFFWLDHYHADGLRVDAVASMLYLDYSRKPGEWTPNPSGGREHLEAIEFLRQFNVAVYEDYPDVQTVAEESTAWPNVSRPTFAGGLGFGYKWDMGFAHDTLQYFREDPLYRKSRHDKLTFRPLYAFQENFVLPFSHDDVVLGKGSLFAQMPGDDWQKLANLRLLFGYTYLLPGKKLLFMGSETGQRREWNHESTLEWDLPGAAAHAGLQNWVGDLNRVYRKEAALHQSDALAAAFEWVDCCDAEQSVLSWLRWDPGRTEVVLAVCNFTPVVRRNYRVGVPRGGPWREILNSDAKDYGGSGQGNFGGAEAVPLGAHGRSHTLVLTLPPLAAICFKSRADQD